MKVLLPVLLAALLGVERAHSLVCFSCTNKNSNFYCLKPTICSDSDNYCVTVSASAGIGSSLPCRRSHLAASWADERLAAGHSVSSQFFLGPDRRPSALRGPEARPAVSKARGRVQGHEVRGPDEARLPCGSESCNSAARPALPGGLSCKTRRSHPAAGSRGDLGTGTHRRKRSVLDLGPWMAKMLSKEDFQ
uniref:Lymphocyte antigen 6 family member E n=1 Tax=Sus scrofa TaxID=9823 RepID=A0A8D1N875_PIG